MTEDKPVYLAGLKADRRSGQAILVIFKAVLRFAILGGMALAMVYYLRRFGAINVWEYLLPPAIAIGLVAAAAFWAVERIGK